jgi:hypothetical protein
MLERNVLEFAGGVRFRLHISRVDLVFLFGTRDKLFGPYICAFKLHGLLQKALHARRDRDDLEETDAADNEFRQRRTSDCMAQIETDADEDRNDDIAAQ